MAERATLFQRIQIGVAPSANPGSAVPATYELASLSIEPSVKVEVDTFRPMGRKFATVTSLGKEWTEADIKGKATYTEAIYPLSSVLGRGTAVLAGTGGGGSAFTWTFSPKAGAADDPATFTIEQGSSERAHRFTYGIVKEFGVSWKRDGIELSGSMLGRRLEDGITMSGTTTQFNLVPVLPTEVNVYFGTSPAHLNSVTALQRVLSFDWKISERYGPVWTLDASQNSWVAIVETEPKLDVSMMLEADSEGMAMLPLVRSGATRYVRVEGVGGSISTTGVSYRFRIDTAIKFTDVGNFSDEDGVYAVEFSATGVSDGSGWGGTATVVTINNELRSL
jgi:hypothetical protein